MRQARLLLPERHVWDSLLSSPRLSQGLEAHGSCYASRSLLASEQATALGQDCRKGFASGGVLDPTAAAEAPQLLQDTAVPLKNWSARQLRKPQNSGRKQFERMYKRDKFIALQAATRKAGERQAARRRETLQKERWKKAAELFGSRNARDSSQEATASL